MQCSWTYIAQAGKPYHVGLYHGTHSGHLVIYVNQRIVLIDFGIKDSKTFSFFIEDDLCHIRLVRRNDKMFYYFEIDKTAPTKANKHRKTHRLRNLKNMLIWFGIPLLLTTLFAVWLQVQKQKKYKNPQEINTLLSAQAQESSGLIISVPQKPPGKITYVFTTNKGEVITGYQYIERQISKPNTLQAGDSCIIRYSPQNPLINKLIYPTPQE